MDMLFAEGGEHVADVQHRALLSLARDGHLRPMSCKGHITSDSGNSRRVCSYYVLASRPEDPQIRYKPVIARSPQGDAAISSQVGALSTRLLRGARYDEPFWSQELRVHHIRGNCGR